MRHITLIGLLFTAACGTTSQSNAPPPDAKAVILANKGRLWKDPDSIKAASITEPTRHLGFMWHVCVRLNAKNSFGGYVGERENLIGLYDDGRPPELLLEHDGYNCPGRAHSPFPDLEGVQPSPKRS